MGIEKEYNKEIEQIAKDRNFRRINHFVMITFLMFGMTSCFSSKTDDEIVEEKIQNLMLCSNVKLVNEILQQNFIYLPFCLNCIIV